MPLKLNLGLARKIGQPDYGSLSASCHIEVELDQSLLNSDLDGFHAKVKQAFVACNQAVKDELHRQAENNQSAGSSSSGNGNGHLGNSNGRGKQRQATASQCRALEAIAHKRNLDLADFLTQRFRVTTPQELSISEASGLLDEFNSSNQRKAS
jgi:hypothetical protein